MKKPITVYEAVRLWIKGLEGRVAFFDSELYLFIDYIREAKMFNKHPVKGLRKNTNLRRKYAEISDYLVENKLVQKGYNNYFIIGTDKPNELEIVCSLYATGYISYLSAMRFYDLTAKVSKYIDYVAPTRSKWKSIKSDKFIDPYPSENIAINKKYLNVCSRSNLTCPMSFGNNVRMIKIGHLFLEMTRYPKMCGGLEHVLEVYEHTAKKILDEIIFSTNEHGTNIDKCRVGFILNSYLNITDSRILEWKTQSIARGGSRKMISDEAYSEKYDDEWCISLNHNVFN